MKKLALMAAVAAAAVFAPMGAAQAEGVYGSLGYTHYDADGADGDAVTGRLGWRFHPNFAVEGEASIGVSDDLDNQFGAFVVGVLPVAPEVDLFARIGYATAEFEGGGDDDGVAGGAGLQWNVNENLGVRGEYTRYDGDTGEADAVSVSAVWNF